MFTLNQKELLATLKEHNQFTKSHGMKLSVLDHILVQVDESLITFISTNLINEYTTTFTSSIYDKKSTFTIPKKQAIDFISKLSSKKSVTIKKIQDGWIEILQEETKAMFMGIDVEDYPTINSDEIELEQIDAVEWKQVLKSVNYIKPQSSEGRTHILGLCLKKDSISSTDGNRLSSCKITELKNEKLSKGVLIPKECAIYVEKMLGKYSQNAKFGFDGACFVFFQFNKKLIFQALEGDFPDLPQITDIFEKSMSISLHREQLLNKFELMSTVNNESTLVSISHNQICLTSVNVENRSEIKKCFEVDFNLGIDITVNLNTEYVIQALKSMDDEIIEMWLQSDVMPVFFNGNVFNVIMPKKI
jgi:DNA polymerase III sliding clamp (beta) subunit (PCNA family)